jgi:hypothetical protein
MKLSINDQGILLATDLIQCIVSNQPIEPIDNVIVEGDIELNSVNYDYKLTIRNTRFKGLFDVSESHFHRSVDLSGCIFEHNINFCDAHIERNLILTEVEIKATKEEEKEIGNFERINVQGWLNARGLQSDVKLNFNHSNIGKLTLSSLASKRTICREDASFIGAKIAYQFDCSGIEIIKELIMQGIDIHGDFFCNTDVEHNYCTEINSSVFMVGARVLGRVDFSGAKIGSELNLEIAEIRGGLDFKPERNIHNQDFYYTEIKGDVNLGASKISPCINFHGAKIHGDVILQIAKITGNIFFNNYENHFTEIIGMIDGSGSHINGSVDFSSANINKDIYFKNAYVKGSVSFRSLENKITEIGGNLNFLEVDISGSVDFSGAKIAGDVDFKRASIKSKIDSMVIDNHRTDIGGNLNFAGAKITGSINFIGSKIAKDMIFKGAEILGSLNCRSDATYCTEISGKLNLKRLYITSSIDFKDAEIQGCIDLKDSHFGSQFYCNLNKTNLGNSARPQANFQDATIHSLIIKIDNESNKIYLNLTYAKVLKLEIQNYLPSAKYLDLEGFEYKEIILPDLESDNKYIKFLEAANFNESNYLFMEQWLRDQGAQIDANHVYVEMRRRNRRERVSEDIWTIRKWQKLFQIALKGKNQNVRLHKLRLWIGFGRVIKSIWTVFIRRLYDKVLDVTMLYGTATNRLLFFYFIPVLIFSWLLFSSPQSVQLQWNATGSDFSNPQIINRLDPQKRELMENNLVVHPTKKDWTSTNAFWLALKISFPVIQFSSSDNWSPSSRPISIIPLTNKITLISYDTYAKIITVLSWIIVPLFLAGVSGIVKK